MNNRKKARKIENQGNRLRLFQPSLSPREGARRAHGKTECRERCEVGRNEPDESSAGLDRREAGGKTRRA